MRQLGIHAMVRLRTLDWPGDRAAVLALDTSYVTDRTLRLELTPRSASLVEDVLPAPLRHDYNLADTVDALPNFAWVRMAHDGAGVVGVAALAFETWNRRARLEHLYVGAGERGRGVGRALIEAAVEAAGALGARGVWVETQTTNVAAVRFYERAGFRWCGLDSSLYDPAAVADGEVGLFFFRQIR